MLETGVVFAKLRSPLTKKWKPTLIGPLIVLRKVCDVLYKIGAPLSMKKAHNVINASVLKQCKEYDITRGINVINDAQDDFELELGEIIDNKETMKTG